MSPGSRPIDEDLFIHSFIGACVAGVFVFAIALPVTNLGRALESSAIAFLVVFILLSLLMWIVTSTRNAKLGRLIADAHGDVGAPIESPRK